MDDNEKHEMASSQAVFNRVLHFQIGDVLAAWVDELSFLNVSTFCTFELVIAPTAHEEHVEAFALLPD